MKKSELSVSSKFQQLLSQRRALSSNRQNEKIECASSKNSQLDDMLSNFKESKQYKKRYLLK